VLAIENRPKGTIAWAWGMNGAFTVIGGVLSIIASVLVGFTITLIGALAIYGLAALLFPALAKAPAPVTVPSAAHQLPA